MSPLLSAATPTSQVLEEKSFWNAYREFTGAPEMDTHSYGDISRYADRPLPDGPLSNAIDLLSECPSRSDDANGSLWSLGWVGGDVVDSIKRTETAYVHRHMLTLLRPTPVWPNAAAPGVGEDLLAWTDAMIDIIAPYTPAESYQNFPNRRILDWPTQYYAENLDRLIDVKSRHDSDNMFRHAQSIPIRT
ncbi:MAG: BBE domain-containing protein [Acidimicrobiales bacterium]